MIRKFEKSDIDQIMQIWLNENTKAHDFIPSNYWLDNYSFVQEALCLAEIYVATIDAKVVGFIGLNENYIEGIFVDSNIQSQGVGTSLLNYVKEIKTTLALSVYQKNDHAFRFYQRHGFIIEKQDVDEMTNEIEYVMHWQK